MEDWLAEYIENAPPLPVEPTYSVSTYDPFEDREGPIQALAII